VGDWCESQVTVKGGGTPLPFHKREERKACVHWSISGSISGNFTAHTLVVGVLPLFFFARKLRESSHAVCSPAGAKHLQAA
jgi:hypothetical protein